MTAGRRLWLGVIAPWALRYVVATRYGKPGFWYVAPMRMARRAWGAVVLP